MARKREDKDVAASFFGDDDLDWLADDDSEVAERPAPEPPPEPAQAPPAAAPEPPPAAPEPAPQAPAPVAREPELQVAPPPPPAYRPAEPPPQAVRLEPIEKAPVEWTDDADVTEAEDRAPVADPNDATIVDGGPAVLEEPVEAVFADDLDDVSEEVPLVRSQDPSPPRDATPEPDAGGLGFSPPVAAAPPIEAFAPKGDEEEWREAISSLVSEAAHLPADERGPLLVEAGRLYLHRLGDPRGAEAVLDDARAAGHETAELFRLQADAALAREDGATAVEALVHRALQLEGAASAESLRAAAGLAASRLGRPDLAIAYLREAAQRDPSDYASLVMLRDLLGDASTGDQAEERADVLRRIAELAGQGGGHVTAAQAWLDQGRVLQQLGRVQDARKAFERAREADPTLAPAFLALEAIFVQSGDQAARAALYAAEATREGQPEPAWWHLKAARAWQDAGDTDAAAAAYEAAVETGDPQARREHQAWLQRTERWSDLAASLRAEADALSSSASRAFVLYQLGSVLERRLDDTAGALAAYRAASEADPSAGPAADGVTRLLLRTGADKELYAFFEARLEAATDPSVRLSTLYRLAEVAEGSGDNERSRGAFERILSELAPDYLPALEGLQRVYTRLERWSDLAGVYEKRGDLAQQPVERALQYYRAGAVYQQQLDDVDRARASYERALDLVPDHASTLDAYVQVLEALGEWGALAAALRSAAEASPSLQQKTSLFYRAGRVYADRTSDVDAAVDCLRQCLQVNPEFLPALGLLKDLSGQSGPTEEVYRLHRTEAAASADASARAWRLLAAAEAAEGLPGIDPRDDLLRVLDDAPDHPGALAAYELLSLREGERSALVEAYRRAADVADGVEKARLTAQLADILQELGDVIGAGQATAALRNVDAPSRPLRAVALLASAQQDWSDADALLAPLTSAEDRLERARLLAGCLGRRDEAVALYRDLLQDPDGRVRAALGAAGVVPPGTDDDLLRLAHGVIAEFGASEPVRAAHGLWTASLMEQAGDDAQALAQLEGVLALRSGATEAFDAARRLLVSRGDADGLRALFAAHRPDDTVGLATALEQAGDLPGAVDALRRVADTDAATLGVLVQLERALVAVEDWHGVYDVLTRRSERVRDEAGRAALDARRRWVLSEKLADTDEAWDLYGKLHEEHPEDREVTEALARIAGARGEQALAVQYLRELVAGATTADDKARYERRIAEVHERNGDTDAARQAWLDALDHKPDDFDALAGLERLGRDAEDWQAVVGVLQRRANLVTGEERLAVLREIARMGPEQLGGPDVAIDAWRAVLDAQAGDPEALEQLIALSERQAAWELFVESADALAAQREGAERGALLRRVGVVLEDELNRDDASRYYEQAVAQEPPDLEAARRLEKICRQLGDLAGAVRCLAVQARVVDDTDDKVALLADAAGIEANVRHDRDAAARLYEQVLALAPSHERALAFQADYLYENEDRRAEALPVFEALEPIVTEGKDLDDFDTRIEIATFFFHMAELLRAAGRIEDALKRYDRALELNPTHLPTLEAAGPLYIEAASWKKAERVYRQLLQLTGGFGDKKKVAETYTRLGVVERALGNLDKASKRFNKALELYPNYVGALKGMALVLEDREDWNAVLNFYNNVIYHATVPEDVVHAYMTKGRILDDHMKRPDKAAQHYERSLAFDANQPVALLRLAEIAMRDGNWHEAGGLAQRGLQLTPEPGPLRADLLLGWAAARKASGDVDGARDAVREACGAVPELEAELGDTPLEDLEALRERIRKRLPA